MKRKISIFVFLSLMLGILLVGCGPTPPKTGNGTVTGSSNSNQATSQTPDINSAFKDYQKALAKFRKEEQGYGLACQLGGDNALSEGIYIGAHSNLLVKRIRFESALRKSNNDEWNKKYLKVVLQLEVYLLHTRPGVPKKNLNSITSGLTYKAVNDQMQAFDSILKNPSTTASEVQMMVDPGRDLEETYKAYQEAVQRQAPAAEIKLKAQAYNEAKAAADRLKNR